MSDEDTESPLDEDPVDAFAPEEEADIDIPESKEDILRRKKIRRMLERKLERKRLREELDDFIDLDEEGAEDDEDNFYDEGEK